MFLLDPNIQLICVVLFGLYLCSMGIIMVPAVYYHLVVKEEPHVFLRWWAGPLLWPLRQTVHLLIYLVFGAVLIILVLLIPVAILVRPLRPVLEKMAENTRRFYAAFRSQEAFVEFFMPMIRFGEKIMLYREVLPSFLEGETENKP